MLCPVCRKDYSMEDIENHLDLCFNTIDERIANQRSSVPKRSFPFVENSDETNPPKKYKAITVPTSVNMNQQKTILNNEHIPLAERMRPEYLKDYIGQEQVIGIDKVLHQLLSNGHIPSMILWGPPGCGKTSLVNIISKLSKEMHGNKVHIAKLSATSCGINSIRDVVNTAKNGSKLNHQTIIFMDEIHRFNKLQQDIFLPHVEAGTFTLIGTTTENPSYSLNSALLSRCRVFGLQKLTVSNIVEILCKAISSLNGEIYNSQPETLSSNSQNKSYSSKINFSISKAVVDWLAEVCDGDARVALNGLELAVKTKESNKVNPSQPMSIRLEDIKESLKQAHMLSDKQTNNSHHLYSALHKSIKAGKENAALYWLARIIAVKEDPVDIARRLVRISSEDVGLADIDALGIAVHTMHGCQMIGMPECDLLLAQCVVYLTRAPKSQIIYNALKFAKNVITEYKGPQPAVPLHIRSRSAKGKLHALLGLNEKNLLKKEECIKTHLPLDLEHVDFFLEDLTF